MIISNNPYPSLAEFQQLMAKTDCLLNKDALNRPQYYAMRNGSVLEDDVKDALSIAAKGTAFDNTIKKISGQRFPDIIAAHYYGVEVKSTKDNHWTSTGSSILETTRVDGVERIYMTFGKLGGTPIEFLSKPYEQCLCGIAVTHMPRYLINMQLHEGETIFDKMGISYDELRLMNNPISPVAKYYRSLLKEGESLWWANTENIAEETTPLTVKLWSTLSLETKELLIVRGYALFPEILEPSNPQKYNRYALWLVTEKSIVNTNIRDAFSAGGRVPIRTTSGVDILMPAAFGRIKKHNKTIQKTLEETPEQVLKEYWGTNNIEENRLRQWCCLVADFASSSSKMEHSVVWNVLSSIFPQIIEPRAVISKNLYIHGENDYMKVADKHVLYNNSNEEKS